MATLTIFVEKFYSCYKDDLDSGKDMRSFASLYRYIGYLHNVEECLSILFAYGTPYRMQFINFDYPALQRKIHGNN